MFCSLLRLDLRLDSKRLVLNIGNSLVSEHRNECDSHADTCVCGNNFAILEGTVSTRTVSIYGFSNQSAAHKDVPIATVCTAYVHPDTGSAYLLVINEALYVGDKTRGSLLNPNQLRHYGVTVNDVPIQYDPTSTHSIHAETESGDAVVIPLSMNGVMSGFESSYPTQDDMAYLPRVILTSDQQWDPKSQMFADNKDIAKKRNVSATATVSIRAGGANFDLDTSTWHNVHSGADKWDFNRYSGWVSVTMVTIMHGVQP